MNPGFEELQIACAYARYSCDNSNPRSLAQQLRNILEVAKRQNYFIPWQYVFADAAVSGTTTDRRGYQLSKELIRVKEFNCDCLLVDELGRASRDMIESLLLGRLVEHYHKRMVGASDGFDSRLPQSLVTLTIFAMMHQFFVQQLRDKVARGMNDAFIQGKNITHPCLGYKVVPVMKEDGTYVLRQNGKVLTKRDFDPDAVKYVQQAFQLYSERGWSTPRIARYFNSRRVGNSRSWDSSNIFDVLRRELYIGREYYGMTRSVLSAETGEVSFVKVPKSQWKCREVPDMRIISDDLWHKTQQRMKECSEAFAKRKKSPADSASPRLTRMQAYPRLLFRPTCGYCKQELQFGKSGKYASLCCANGSRRKKGCKLHSYKSIRVIDKSLSDFLLIHLCTEDFLKEVVVQANNFLQHVRARPKIEIQPAADGIKKLIAQRDRLSATIQNHDASDIACLVKRLRAIEKQITESKKLSKTEETVDLPVPPPIELQDVTKMITSLPELLNEDVLHSSRVLKAIFGDIEVTELKEKGRTRPVWIARFTLNAVPMMLHLAKAGKHPNSECWEYLTQRGWKNSSNTVELLIKTVPIYEAIGPEVLRLKKLGYSDEVIGRKLSTATCNVKYARDFSEKGIRPPFGPTRKRTGAGTTVKYKAIADEVYRLRYVEMMHMHEIAKKLKCREVTVRKAHDYKLPQVIKQAVESGVSPERGRSIRLRPDVYASMRKLIISSNLCNAEIARQCGCSDGTVARERKFIAEEKKSA